MKLYFSYNELINRGTPSKRYVDPNKMKLNMHDGHYNLSNLSRNVGGYIENPERKFPFSFMHSLI